MSCFGKDIRIKWGGGNFKRKSIYAFCVTCKFKMKYIFFITRHSTLLLFSIFLISIGIRYSCKEYSFHSYNIKKIWYSRNTFKNPPPLLPHSNGLSPNIVKYKKLVWRTVPNLIVFERKKCVPNTNFDLNIDWPIY